MGRAIYSINRKISKPKNCTREYIQTANGTNENYKQFISEFATLLAHLDRCNSDVIIGGDFNIDLLKVNDKPIVSEYLDMVISHGFFPKITLPTRLSERSGTLIDNFLCKLTHNFAHIISWHTCLQNIRSLPILFMVGLRTD